MRARVVGTTCFPLPVLLCVPNQANHSDSFGVTIKVHKAMQPFSHAPVACSWGLCLFFFKGGRYTFIVDPCGVALMLPYPLEDPKAC